ncbi:hypothetical protein ACFQ51_37605 [Streptomyces kaempferi]
MTVPVLWTLHHAIVGRGLALHAALTPGRVRAPRTGPPSTNVWNPCSPPPNDW